MSIVRRQDRPEAEWRKARDVIRAIPHAHAPMSRALQRLVERREAAFRDEARRDAEAEDEAARRREEEEAAETVIKSGVLAQQVAGKRLLGFMPHDSHPSPCMHYQVM
mgnify:CR=1 FL=1